MPQSDAEPRLSESRGLAADQELAANRARLDYAVRLSGVGFWYCPLPFDVLHWDERVKEHFFFPPEATIHLDDFYARIHPEDREPTRRAIDRAVYEHRTYDTIYRTVDPNSGAVRWIRALGGAAYDTDGSPTNFDGVTVDVTEQRLVQERLSQALGQLREQDRRKDEFLATLAHELRNPLAPIRAGLEILRRGGDIVNVGHTVEVMDRQLRHLVRLVDDLLDISRITLGKVELRRERVDFRTVLSSALETTRPVIESLSHELSTRIPAGELPIDVDPTRLAQVFANLFNNAAKFTPPGGRIQLNVETHEQELLARVTDNGLGIPADMLTRVFELFAQGEDGGERRHAGLGIGLTLARRLVEMHGGTVVAESPGRQLGSTFTVRLPLDLSSADMRADATKAESAVEPLHVLVVDDNADAAETLAMLLSLWGHTSVVAYNGRDALQQFEAASPDVVLLDIGLPDTSGYEVARTLRTTFGTQGKHVRIIALTGWGTEQDRRQTEEAGFDEHLVKPVDPARLFALLAEKG